LTGFPLTFYRAFFLCLVACSFGGTVFFPGAIDSLSCSSFRNRGLIQVSSKRLHPIFSPSLEFFFGHEKPPGNTFPLLRLPYRTGTPLWFAGNGLALLPHCIVPFQCTWDFSTFCSESYSLETLHIRSLSLPPMVPPNHSVDRPGGGILFPHTSVTTLF